MKLLLAGTIALFCCIILMQTYPTDASKIHHTGISSLKQKLYDDELKAELTKHKEHSALVKEPVFKSKEE
uniref:Putative secreted protein n=1 Tax=Panstrongylus lignarius TaxID=156445 RepID=A0A224Y556_9HEMI